MAELGGDVCPRSPDRFTTELSIVSQAREGDVLGRISSRHVKFDIETASFSPGPRLSPRAGSVGGRATASLLNNLLTFKLSTR